VAEHPARADLAIGREAAVADLGFVLLTVVLFGLLAGLVWGLERL
jgi:hypothetical protein